MSGKLLFKFNINDKKMPVGKKEHLLSYNVKSLIARPINNLKCVPK